MNKYSKYPRLYTESALTEKNEITFSEQQAHYLKNVLRKNPGDPVRVFNSKEGEFIAKITTLKKKNGQAVLEEKIKEQPAQPHQTQLLFAPLKKKRMDFLIEKAVELGVTDLHPVITARTEVRTINEQRLQSQIIEAAEQCERLNIPTLHALAPLQNALQNWANDTALYACFERGEHPSLSKALKTQNTAFLIGPVGGFEETEIELIKTFSFIQSVSLGEQVLRCETAAIACLSYAKLTKE